VICQCCGKQKQSVTPKKSTLIAGNTILVCDLCRERKYEPRHIIVIVGRSKGPQAVREHINKRLYAGDEITASELIP
jgi:hypothetical protein